MLRPTLAALAGAAALAFGGVAQAATLIYSTQMNGANEVPATGSPATGFTLVTIDSVANSMNVQVTFSGLTGGPAAAAHIHCCTPVGTNTGVAVGFTGFPAATSGSYNNTFDLTNSAIYTSGFLTASGGTAAGAEAALLAGLAAHQAYSNIHNATFPGGEIRGFLRAGIPEPASWARMIAGFGLVGATLRRRTARLAA
jgi:hypothetical protein